ncbi:MAG TPA: translin family protein [Candidatus Bathyarchaeota archaeon]|nr:translin family protein [Candidatus Bathyarchaeota archaeon]
MSLKATLEKIQEELSARETVREEVERDMRKARRLSKQAIQVTHQERFDDAKAMLKEAKSLFVKLQETAKDHPHLLYSDSVGAAFEENAEAHILLTLIQEDRFVGPKEIGVLLTPYVLSLGDVVGELRRRTLDLIRRGNVEEAEKTLETMEQIYSELMALDDAYIIVKGLRRKGDVARHLIEITRGDLTSEVRRSALERALSELEKTIKKGNRN